MTSWNVWRCASSNNKEQSKKFKFGIPCGDEYSEKSFELLFSGLIPSGWPRRESSRARPRPHLAFRRGALLLPSGWPRRESSRARPRPSLAFRRCALLLPSGWPRRESNPDLAFRKRLFYPLNYSANIYNLYSIISTLPLDYTHHYAPSSDFLPAS